MVISVSSYFRHDKIIYFGRRAASYRVMQIKRRHGYFIIRIAFENTF